MKDYTLENRRYVIAGAAIFIVAVYIVRLFMLQISSDDYKKSADSNAFLKKVDFPRGASSPTATGSCLSSTSHLTTSWW